MLGAAVRVTSPLDPLHGATGRIVRLCTEGGRLTVWFNVGQSCGPAWEGASFYRCPSVLEIDAPSELIRAARRAVRFDTGRFRDRLINRAAGDFVRRQPCPS